MVPPGFPLRPVFRRGRVFRREVIQSALAIQAFCTSPLWAIPSPDLVINFFASSAQILGLATVVIGGFAASGRRKRGKGSPGGLRWPFRIVLALFLVSIASNVLQYSSSLDEKNRRLTTNLWRSSQEAGKKVGDVNLKTLSYSDQLEHPRAVTTDAVAAIAAAGGAGYNLIDVREPEEVEMGTIAGAWHRRYPDLKRNRSGLIVEGKETILLCESGNRSSELVEEFSKEHLPCRFMTGGYEKWVAEGHPMVGEKVRVSGEIRDIPDYPNKLTLLDTPDVERLLEEEKVLFVDVRYPGEFGQGHLPQAINLTMRAMPDDELWAALKALPKRPIVAPCYDKRSSFYAMILGLRLHRLGYDFRGRYTVPHEFALPIEEKAHVAQWKDRQKGKTLLAAAARPIDGLLGYFDETTGHLALAILIVVGVVRLLILPLTLKADRDQLVQMWIAPELKALKGKLAADPGRLARAILGVHRRHGLTPGRNAIASICQVVVFLLLFLVVQDASADSDQGLAWIASLGAPDPAYVLPAAAGALVAAQVYLGGARRTRLRLALSSLAGLAIFALVFQLRAGTTFYLATNLSFLFVQTQVSRRLWTRERSRKPRPRCLQHLEKSGIVFLKLAHQAPGTGNKAGRLGRLIEEGLPVPGGFVITDKILGRQGEKLELSGSERRQISRAWSKLQARKVAVRSSGLNEDGSEKSYAGVFESVLNVPPEKLLDALQEVYQSMRSRRAAAYGGQAEERGAIVIQKMVDAEYAGVLFTEHPTSAGSMMIEMVEGLGESLVSGTATPKTYRFGRVSGTLIDSPDPPIDCRHLLELGKQIEAAFGKPQDIEWASARGKFYILQARDITRSCRDGAGDKPLLERERKRLLDLAERSAKCRGRRKTASARLTVEEPAFIQNEISELLPRPTALSLSLMDGLWKSGGSTDIACRSLGIPYQVDEDSLPYVNTVFGALYVNRIEERNRREKGPGALAAFRLGRSAEAIEREFRDEFLPGYLEEVRIRESIDPSRLRVPEILGLLRKWIDRFVGETYVRAERINLAADFYLKAARKEIEKRGLDPAAYLSHLPETVVHRAMSLLPAIRDGERTAADILFLEIFGHRAPNDYELSQPRYRESSALVGELASRALETTSPESAPPPELPADRFLRVAVERARRFQSLKEEAKHHALRELAAIRSLIVEVGARLELHDGIFHLSLDEVYRLESEEFLNQALDVIAQRKELSEKAKQVELPTQLSVTELEALEIDGRGATTRVRKGRATRGVRVSGDKEVIGRVRVAHSPADVDEFQRGEILVARFTDPTWMPLFPLAGGVVTEVGGWLSHAAIVAREYGIVAIVGAVGSLDVLKTGDLIRLCSDGSVERIRRERRSEDRIELTARAAILRQGEIVDALIRNISRTGALLEVEEELLAGQEVSIRMETDGEEVRAEVVRRDASGSYAVQFTQPLRDLPRTPSQGTAGPSGN